MSKNIDQNDERIIKDLQRFDLSEKDAMVYLALLPRRDVGSSKLILATKLHKQFVYNSLGKLEALGLAKHVIQKGRKKFSANTPQRILSILEEKKLSAISLTKNLQERYIGAHEQDVEVFQGDAAFIAHQMDILERSPDDSKINVIGSETEKYGDTFRKEEMWEEFEKLRIKKKISIRYIGSTPQKKALEERRTNDELFTYRILPGHSTGLVNTDVWENNVTFNIFGKPIISISVSGKEIADGYREFYETLWNLSS